MYLFFVNKYITFSFKNVFFNTLIYNGIINEFSFLQLLIHILIILSKY
jgi:hypothetical protein